jgi:hypothetical protein
MPATARPEDETDATEELGHRVLSHAAAFIDHPWALNGAGIPRPDEACMDELGTVEELALDTAVSIGLYLDQLGLNVEGFFELVVDKLDAHGVNVGRDRDDYEG